MTQHLVPEATIAIGDREVSLKLNFRALIRFEQATGRNLLDGTSSVSDLTVEQLIKMIWAMSDGSVTVDEISDALSVGQGAEVLGTVMSLWVRSMPQADPEEPKSETEPAVPFETSG